MHGLQTVPHIGQRSSHNNRHGILRGITQSTDLGTHCLNWKMGGSPPATVSVQRSARLQQWCTVRHSNHFSRVLQKMKDSPQDMTLMSLQSTPSL